MGNTRHAINQQQSIRKMNTKLLYVSTSIYENDWHSTLHSHYFAELFYVIHGEGSFVVEDKVFSVKEGDLIIINPNIEHTEKSINASPLEYVVLGIDGLVFNFHQEDPEASYSVFNFRNNKRHLQFYMTSMLEEIEEQKPEYEMVCQNLMEVFLVQIIRAAKYDLIATNIAMSKKINKECSRVKRYLDSNYVNHITIDQLSELTHMNKYYLIHAYSKYAGLSPINYLNFRRIEESKNLLENTDFSIAQISNEVGFSSQAYFAQVFRKLVDSSPNDYRKKKKMREQG
ncbi:MAG: AraC family transcriptional regulator [Mobilitalea sp.]